MGRNTHKKVIELKYIFFSYIKQSLQRLYAKTINNSRIYNIKCQKYGKQITVQLNIKISPHQIRQMPRNRKSQSASFRPSRLIAPHKPFAQILRRLLNSLGRNIFDAELRLTVIYFQLHKNSRVFQRIFGHIVI